MRKSERHQMALDYYRPIESGMWLAGSSAARSKSSNVGSTTQTTTQNQNKSLYNICIIAYHAASTVAVDKEQHNQ
jgi:hypothetical protein